MTDDPRAQARLRGASYRELTHAQQLERIKQRLAPSDDDLPIAQAVRDKELRRKNVEGGAADVDPADSPSAGGAGRPPASQTAPSTPTETDR